jgi:hypothetical protein
MPDMIGQSLGRYHILEQLGSCVPESGIVVGQVGKKRGMRRNLSTYHCSVAVLFRMLNFLGVLILLSTGWRTNRAEICSAKSDKL